MKCITSLHIARLLHNALLQTYLTTYVFSGSSETEEQLQFPLELCADSSSNNTQPPSKISGSLKFLLFSLSLLPDLPLCPASLTGHCPSPPLTLQVQSLYSPQLQNSAKISWLWFAQQVNKTVCSVLL